MAPFTATFGVVLSMAVKLIPIDLQDTLKEGNTSFFNLLDKGRWDQLIAQVESEKTLEVLVKELITDEHEVTD